MILIKSNALVRYFRGIIPLLGLSIFSINNLAFADSPLENNSDIQRYFEYQQAAQFTHLKWNNTLRQPISLELHPIQNFTGIPMENRQESADYFYYGKLPAVMNQIYADAFVASRIFSVNSKPADYQIELTLDEYKLPFKYSPDDTWWQTLHDQSDRWLQNAQPTYVKLTLTIKSGQKQIKPFMDSVEMVLSHCDLNATPQPATTNMNRHQLARSYLTTTPGQTFLAATNFLVLRAVDRLSQESLLGRVESKFGDEIYLLSHTAEFVAGQEVDVFFNHTNTGQARQSAGKLRVIKAMGAEALAYPVNLRADHLTIGDWVAVKKPVAFTVPPSQFNAANQCAAVYSAEVEDI